MNTENEVLNSIYKSCKAIAMESMTVPEIKDFAINQEIKIPSGLAKNLLIRYINGILKERELGIVKNNTSTVYYEKLISVFADGSIDWLVHLYMKGWAVVPLEWWDDSYMKKFFDFLESCCENFRREDSNTWTNKNLPVLLHGILKHQFGHTELQWELRERCAPIFARIWSVNTDELLSSFDGGCFSIPNKKDNFPNWIHNDSPYNTTGFNCVQGLVNFADCGPNDGGLVLVNNSNHRFADYMTRHPSEGITWGKSDLNDPVLQDDWLKICAPAGSLVLWDGRMFHSNCPPSPNSAMGFRMCTYVSMQPRYGATKEELIKRCKWYKTGRMTGHWCYGTWLKATAEKPRTYGNEINTPESVEIAELNELQIKLVGF